MKRYLYIRYSSDEQSNGDSEKRQLNKGKAWALARNVTIDDIIYDRGVSSYHGANRTSGNFAKLVKVARAGDWILIENHDRFGRDGVLEFMIDLRDLTVKQGVTVFFLDSNIEVNKDNFHSAAILLSNIMTAFVGNQENVKKTERIGKAWAAKKKAAANGVKLGRNHPVWLNLDKEGNLFTPNEKVKVVTNIFESYSTGLPIRGIVKQLNEHSVQPFGTGNKNKSKTWSSTSVRRIITSRSVLGEIVFYTCVNKSKRHIDSNFSPLPDYYPRIISNELFYKCQEILSRNNYVKGSRTNITNLFTGFVKCFHCGGSMIVKHNPKGEYFYTLLRCANAANHAGCAANNTIQYIHVERAVLSVMWSEVIRQMSDDNSRQEKLKAYQAELKDTESGITNLIDAIQAVGIDETITNRINKLKNNKLILVSEVERLQSIADNDDFISWKPCENSHSNRYMMQNILRGAIDILRIDTKAKVALLKLKDPDITFELKWEYKRANQTVKNPADEGFILSDKSGGSMINKSMPYVDKLLVWKTEGAPAFNIEIA